ncbi:MAG: CBS domain-containing protein [Desulfobacterales bacterium]|nr:CBS domain-containing protein [Desulfobacterales bacterium]
MKIKDLMIPDPITIAKSATIKDAIAVMKANSIRHLPVVTRGKRFAGLVTLADLKQGLIPSMVAGVTLADLMVKDTISVSPDSDIEIAARLIYEHKISGMPVLKKKTLVGIITETDMLRAFIDMMGILTASSRIDVRAHNDNQGGFRKALEVISASGGDVINVGMATLQSTGRMYYFRLKECKTADICKALEKNGFEVISATN